MPTRTRAHRGETAGARPPDPPRPTAAPQPTVPPDAAPAVPYDLWLSVLRPEAAAARAPGWRALLRAAQVTTAVGYVAALVTTLGMFSLLLNGVAQPQMMPVTLLILPLYAVVFIGLGVHLFTLVQPYRGRCVLALRDIAATSELTLAPLAAEQPGNDDNHPATQPIVINLLRSAWLHREAGEWRVVPGRLVHDRRLLFVWLVVPILASAIIILNTLASLDLPNSDNLLISIPFIGVLYLLIILAGVTPAGAKSPVHVTGDGMVWYDGASPAGTIRWDEATAFFCYRRPEFIWPTITFGGWRFALRSVTRTTYVLAAASGTVSWSHVDVFQAEAEQFARIVAAHTGLPLRDLSAIAQELASKQDNPRRVIAARRRAGQEVAALAAVFPPSTAPERRRKRLELGILAALLVPVVALFVAAVTVFASSAGYLAGMEARATSAPPVFADAFAAPDGHWPVQTNSVGVSAPGKVYTPSGYAVTFGQSGAPVFPGGLALHDGMAVSVTFIGDAGGLAVRADASGTHFLAVQVNYGYFTIYRCPSASNPNASNCDNAIIQQLAGFDYHDTRRHTLLVVMRGVYTICFLDGRFVGTYVDLLRQFPTPGRVGLYNDYGTTTFTNFAIYPLPNNLPPWVVA